MSIHPIHSEHDIVLLQQCMAQIDYKPIPYFQLKVFTTSHARTSKISGFDPNTTCQNCGFKYSTLFTQQYPSRSVISIVAYNIHVQRVNYIWVGLLRGPLP